MMAEGILGRDELPLVRVPVGMSSRLRKAFVAARPRVLLNLLVKARQSVATAARSSGVAGTKHLNEKTDEQELVPTADEQELIPTVLPA